MKSENSVQISDQTLRWAQFSTEIENLTHEIRQSTGQADFDQLKKFERWGRLATVFGYLTAWIFPNPISAYLIAQGIFTRWALVFHPISHGALDSVQALPQNYHSKRFAKGWRRYLDWMDWIKPANWHCEHDILHHHYLGTDKDPDLVWRNSEKIRTLPVPAFVRYFLSILMACIWKPFYYAPNTIAETRHHLGLLNSKQIGWNNWNPLSAEGRELWFECLLPYIGVRFLILPLAFFPLGKAAVISVFINSALAEIMTNLYGFVTIGPNHTGDDIPTFSEASRGRTEFYLRQIVGSVNFLSGTDWRDFIYGGLNYQIEHHLWPSASLLQCRRARPKLKAICHKYGIPYNESPLLPRVWITLQTMAGQSMHDPRGLRQITPTLEQRL